MVWFTVLWFSNPDCDSLQELFGWPLNRPHALKNISKTLFLWPQSPWLKVMFKGCATLLLSSVWKICLNRTKRSPGGELLTLQWTEEVSSPVITSAKLTMSVVSLGIHFTEREERGAIVRLVRRLSLLISNNKAMRKRQIKDVTKRFNVCSQLHLILNVLIALNTFHAYATVSLRRETDRTDVLP